MSQKGVALLTILASFLGITFLLIEISTRYLAEKCQCPSVGTCYHIMAVKMSIGEENIEEKWIYNLTQLRRNNRKRVNKKAGTKKPRPCDKDVTIKFEDENFLNTEKEETSTEIRENPDAENWIENGKNILTIKHKNDIQNNSMLCSDVINFAQTILKQQFPQINGFQHTGYAPIIKEGNWEYKLQMSPEKAPVAQIHHTGYQHWIASLQMNESDKVMILDSCNKKRDYISQSTQLQLGKLYGRGEKTLNVSILDVQQQTNGIDCGVFAIANITDFCIAKDIKDQPIQYDIGKMRDHLIKCLEEKKFEEFPKKQKQKKRLSLTKKRENIQKISMDCAARCSLPNVYDDMIVCENPSCGQWYHLRCVGIQDPKESLIFICPSCAN